MSFRANLSLARRLARTGRNRDGAFWLLFTLVGQKIRLQVKLCRHKIVIRTGSPDLPVALSCLQGEFDELLNAVPTLRRPFIVDAGGYIGTAAIVFAEAYPDATIVSLEPSAENFALLQRNVAPYKNILPIKKALAPNAERLILKDRGTGQWGFTLVPKPADNPASAVKEEVEWTTLDQLMREFGVDGIGILKLDIEGGEHTLLSHNRDWISRTDAICIELHDRIVAGCSDLYHEATAGRHNSKMKGEKYLSIASQQILYDRQQRWQERWSDQNYEAPWMNRSISPEIVEAVASGWFPAGATALDIGCGEGEVAAWMAEHGFPSVGVDIAPAAVARAQARFNEVPGRLEFFAVDVCEGAPPDRQYRVLIDRGCFHTIQPRDYADWLEHLLHVSAPDAKLLLLCRAFRDGIPQGDPHERRRVTASVEQAFGRGFRIVRSADTYLDPFDGRQADKAMGGMVFRMERV